MLVVVIIKILEMKRFVFRKDIKNIFVTVKVAGKVHLVVADVHNNVLGAEFISAFHSIARHGDGIGANGHI